MGSSDGVFKLPRIARVVKDDGMEVAVASMEDIADGEIVFLSDLLNLLEGLGELGARDNAVEDVIAGSEASQRAKGVLPAFPEEVAFAAVLGNAHFAGVVRAADVLDGRGLGFDGFAQAFDFNEQN